MSYDLIISSSVNSNCVFHPKDLNFSVFDFFSQASDNVIRITRISSNLFFSYPISVPYKFSKGMYSLSFSIGNLYIVVCENSYDEMINDFKYQLIESWNYYASEDDINLTDGALEVKHWLIAHISKG